MGNTVCQEGRARAAVMVQEGKEKAHLGRMSHDNCLRSCFDSANNNYLPDCSRSSHNHGNNTGLQRWRR